MFVGPTLAGAALIGIFFPGTVTVTQPAVPGYSAFDETADVPTVDHDVTSRCPPVFGLVESGAEKTARRYANTLPSFNEWATYERRRAQACRQLARDNAAVGFPVAIALLAVTAAGIVLVRRRGKFVFFDRANPDASLAAVLAREPLSFTTATPGRCRVCGRPCPSSSGTVNPPKLGGASRLCEACIDRRLLVSSALTSGASAALLVWGALLRGRGYNEAAALCLFGGGITPLMFLQVAPHEMAHALAGRAVGFRVPVVSIGVGPRITNFRFGATSVDLRAIPSQGHTSALARSTRSYRLRMWVLVAAGPAVSAVLLLLALRWDAGQGQLAGLVRWLVIGAAGCVLLLNLFPYAVRGNGVVQHSDGWQLFKLPFMADAEIARTVVLHRASIAISEASRLGCDPQLASADRIALEDLAKSGDLDAKLVIGIVLIFERNFEQAITVFGDLLIAESASISTSSNSVLLNGLAWCYVMLDEVSADGDADLASELAFALRPNESAVLGTRGSVLIELGQTATGLALLRRSMKGLTNVETALTMCYVAIGEAAAGNPDAALEALASAARADPRCLLLERVHRRLGLRSPPP